ncbi:MAG: M23 family metallopeptidase [Bacteroidales bacterium]|jgi:murein DD-endopeptidase MepM/ murein hydrolase activator NlpD|nr:M23 family metallopeptidase [Bacteroidales bacterium]
MAREKKVKNKTRWLERWKNKYRLVFMNDDTLEERFTFRLSRMNVFVVLGTLTIVLIFLTSILIAFTPLREYIPGYTNIGLTKKLYILQMRADSIERVLIRKDRFIQNLRDVIDGKDLSEDKPVTRDTTRRYSDIKIKRSVEDSLLRVEVENQSKYSLYKMESMETASQKKASIGGVLFFAPLKGIVTNEFNPVQKHYGIDIVAKQNEAIKAVLDGTVILSNWTLETGYVIAIQHAQNIISIYKHNSAILKKTGDIVKSGEPIAIIGESGELVTGPHLHFELWNEGTPVNPKEFILF